MDTSEIIDSNAPRMKEDEFERSFRRLDTDIDYFSKAMFALPLQPKQRLFCQCALDHDYTVGCFCRQSGKSTGDAVLDCKWLALGDKGKVALIGAYAPKWEQSFDIMFMQVMAFMESQPLLEEEIAYRNYSRGILRMYNGNELRAFTAEKNAQNRGHRLTIIQIDEAPEIGDTKIYAELLPTGAAGKRWIQGEVQEGLERKVVKTGTPAGRNHFYEDISNGIILEDVSDIKHLRSKRDIAVIFQPWQESTVISEATVMDAKNKYPPNLFAQEYECKFNFDTKFAFNWGDIEAACTQKKREFTREHDGWYVGGVDLGKNVDHTVLTIFKWNAPMYDMVVHHEWPLNPQGDWGEIIDGIFEHLTIWKPTLTFFDSTGPVGGDLYNKLLVDLPESYAGGIEGYHYDPKTKNELIYRIQRMLARGWVRMFDEPKLMKQLRILPEDRTVSGKVKFDKPKGEHDDRVHSLGLALMAGLKEFGDMGEKTEGSGIAVGIRKEESVWHKLGEPEPYSTPVADAGRKVDDGIGVGSDDGLGSVFSKKGLWENF